MLTAIYSGEISLLKRLLSVIKKQEISDLALSLHNTELAELKKIASTLQALDSDKFNQEFLLYISIKNQLENNQGEYEGLYDFMAILRCGIENNSHFRTIQRIELDYQGKTQLELYKFVFQQLNSNVDKLVFQQSVHQQGKKLISIIINEPIRKVIKSYINALDVISKDEAGLNLLLFFKKYKVANYKIFRTISTFLKSLKKQKLENLKASVLFVKVNYEELEKLGQLIGIPSSSNKPITYAKILQYISLCYKHESLQAHYNQLVDNLLKWQKHHQTIMETRKEYPDHKYKLPAKFTEEIPGENIYEKYKAYLPITE